MLNIGITLADDYRYQQNFMYGCWQTPTIFIFNPGGGTQPYVCANYSVESCGGSWSTELWNGDITQACETAMKNGTDACGFSQTDNYGSCDPSALLEKKKKDSAVKH